jgi:ABC-type iron transport system FetAB permease component
LDRTEKILWATSGVAFIQIMIGFYLSQIEKPMDSVALLIHISLGILLFILAIASYTYTKEIKRLKTLAAVNTSLIAITGLIGMGFISLRASTLYTTYAPYLHLALAIGIISNYAVMLGIKRTLDLKDKL